MKVIRAKSAGFCWGVKRAIEIVQNCAAQGKNPVYTDGPLIHNKQMMAELDRVGVREIGDYQNQSELKFDHSKKDENSVLVARAHGVSPERRKYLKSLNITFKDATCPDVGIIAGKIRMYAKKGYHTLIYGNPQHPEAIGLMGYTEGRGHFIQSSEDIDALPDLGEQVILVSQSTMFTSEFKNLASSLKKQYPKLLVFDTICGATKERQADLDRLVEQGSEAIVVIGGHHSANTMKLVLLAKRSQLPTYHIETADEIDTKAMQAYSVVGVTAGASTPDFIIDAVCEKLTQLEPSIS